MAVRSDHQPKEDDDYTAVRYTTYLDIDKYPLKQRSQIRRPRVSCGPRTTYM